MKKSKIIILIVIIGLFIIGCKNLDKTSIIKNESQNMTKSDFFGNYVSIDYQKRNEGYDWVAVSVIRQKDDNEIAISVRSRADRKNPTCTFDAKAYKLNESTYRTSIDGEMVLFTVKDDTISITPENPKNSGILYFYCSGGASLEGKYSKINTKLDEFQIDKTLFSKVLTLQNIGFNISSKKEKNGNILTIFPFGLSIKNDAVTHEIDGTVINAEIEDLNSDGFPEVLIYITSEGSGSYGDIIGYSVNNGKSISQISFSPVAENDKLKKGYMGHDEFAIVETTLVQRFPIYRKNDANAEPTGKIRQIQYKLKDGEASRIFVVDKVIEY